MVNDLGGFIPHDFFALVSLTHVTQRTRDPNLFSDLDSSSLKYTPSSSTGVAEQYISSLSREVLVWSPKARIKAFSGKISLYPEDKT